MERFNRITYNARPSPIGNVMEWRLVIRRVAVLTLGIFPEAKQHRDVSKFMWILISNGCTIVRTTSPK